MPARAVVGRTAELVVIDEFLTAVQAGPSALVLEEEPRIGKTTLWQATTETAVAHQIAWFQKVQKDYTSIATTLAPMTVADVKQLKTFQETRCGITFSG